jgi:hypothetical protein
VNAGTEKPSARVGELAAGLMDYVEELAGLDPENTPSGVPMDGRPLSPLMFGLEAASLEWCSSLLIEMEPSKVHPHPWHAVRTLDSSGDLLYVERDHTGERELYAMDEDPHQLANRAHEADGVTLARNAERVAAMRGASGETLRDGEAA